MKHTALALSLSFTLVACGSGSSARPDAETTPDAPAAPDLAGRWVSDCVAQPQADGSTLYARLDFQLTGDHWDIDYSLHGDDACAQSLVTVAIAGPYELSAPSAAVDGAWEARFGFDTKTITPHVQPLADALTQAGCGSGAWTVEGTQSVAAGCAAFGQYPLAQCPADYDLAFRDGDTLRFGARPADNDMCTPDKRPTALSPLVLHRE